MKLKTSHAERAKAVSTVTYGIARRSTGAYWAEVILSWVIDVSQVVSLEESNTKTKGDVSCELRWRLCHLKNNRS